MKIKRRHKVELKFEQSEVLFLPLQDSFLTKGIMRNLLCDNPGVEWIDVLKFRGKVHRCYTDPVDFRVVYNSETFLPSKIVIKQFHCEEIGSGRTLEGSADFNHPVNHLSPVVLRHFVIR